jgi:hypothetical protein
MVALVVQVVEHFLHGLLQQELGLVDITRVEVEVDVLHQILPVLAALVVAVKVLKIQRLVHLR